MDNLTFAQILTIQYGYTGYVFAANLEGLSDEDALKQPTPGGNCLAWVAGHLVGSRAGTLEVLGQEPPFAGEKYARFDRGSMPVDTGEEIPPLSEMMADFEATAAGLQAGLVALTDERLVEKAPFSPGGRDDETVGSLLAGLAFHEAYHTGQLGVLRRMTGAAGIMK